VLLTDALCLKGHVSVRCVVGTAVKGQDRRNLKINFKRYPFFRDVTQRILAVSYRRFGTACRPHLPRLSRNVANY